MKKYLDKKQIRNVLYGATFLGSGGGGSLDEGLKLLNQLDDDIKLELIDPDDMEENLFAASIGGIGAPKAMSEFKFGPEAVYAYEGMEKIAFLGGKKIGYTMGGELGGFNTMVPIYVSLKKNIPFVNGDGNGRAVPELSTGLQPINDVLPNPLVVAGANGDTVFISINDPKDHKSAENLSRHVSMANGMSAGFCTWLATGKDVINKLAPYTITECEKIGKAITSSKDGLVDIENKINKIKECKLVCSGKIVDIEVKTDAGFDFGKTVIEGKGQFSNSKYEIFFKNENLLITENEEKTLLTVPDMLCMIDSDSNKPITNADTKVGMNIGIYSTFAPKNWWTLGKGFDNWKHILEKIGYHGDVVKFK